MVSIQNLEFELQDLFRDKKYSEIIFEITTKTREEERVFPSGALLFSCLGRGVHLYKQENHDSECFKSYLGPLPLGGFFCNGEIGPVGGSTFLHGYTSSFGIFRQKEG